MSYVKRIVEKTEPTYEYRRKFDAKLGPTQLYTNEKDLVLLAVADHGYDSISAFCRDAVREKLVELGYEVPPEENYISTEEKE